MNPTNGGLIKGPTIFVNDIPHNKVKMQLRFNSRKYAETK